MTEELHNTILSGVGFALADVHTIVVAKITVVNEKTISCRPVISRVVNGQAIPLPEFIEVPPVIIQGGGSYIAEPVTAGDDCLILISERCYDAWYAGSDFVPPLEMRMHDYSDGFALCGINPQASAISIPAVRRLIQGDSDHNGTMFLTGDFQQSSGTSRLEECVVEGGLKYGSLETAGKRGVTGSFRSDDGKNITVTNGIITGIS